MKRKLFLVGLVLSLIAIVPLYSQNAGDLDFSFSNDGKAFFDLAPGSDESYATAVQADGKILMAGNSVTGSNSDFSLLRLNEDGQLDVTFGTNGKVISSFGSNSEYSRSIVVQSDGKIVIGGFRRNSWNYDFVLIRYLPNGQIDNSFGINGIAINDLGGDDRLYDLKILPDGRFLAVGYSENISGQSDVAVLKYQTNGSLDNSFGVNGKVFLSVGTSSDFGYTLALQADGRFIISGYYVVTSINHDIFVARYNSNGTLDSSFGVNGISVIQISAGKDEIYSSAVLSNGEIVLGGFTMYNGFFATLIVKLNSIGNLDPLFGSSGKIIKSIGAYDDYGWSIIIQSDNKIVLSGTTISNNSNKFGDFFLMRLNPNGSDDLSFGTNGIVVSSIGIYNDESYSSLIQSDGKLVLAGYSKVSSFDQYSIARYHGLCVLPQQPTLIAGNELPCVGSIQEYSVSNNPTILYTWSVPLGCEILNGQGTNTITISIGPNNGIVSVIPSNSCGNGIAQSKSIEVHDVPVISSSISGNSSPCNGSLETYSLLNTPNTTYNWEVPVGYTIASGQGTNSIDVAIGTNSGSVYVVPSNLCGNGFTQVLPILPVFSPGQPPVIIGELNPCNGSIQVYSTNSIAGETYTWTVPNGSEITSGQGTSLIIVEIGSNSGNISVTPSNTCGNGPSQSVFLVVGNLPEQPLNIMGNSFPCQGTIQNYYVNNTVGVNYTWAVPEGWIIQSGQGTNSVNVLVGSFLGNISVIPSNYCGNGLSLDMTLLPQIIYSDAGPNQMVPFGTSTFLNGSSFGGSGSFTYSWEPSSLLINSNIPNPPTINLTSSVQFILTVTDIIYGCSAVDDVVVTVTGGDLFVSTTASPSSICTGESSQLTALVTGGNGNYSYLWSSNPPGFISTVANPIVWPNESTEYFVFVSDGQVSQNSSTIVNVSDFPLIASQPIGVDTVNLMVNIYNAFVTDPVIGASNYNWILEPSSLGNLIPDGTICTIYWNGSIGSALLKVRGVNDCGEGEWSPSKLILIENTTNVYERLDNYLDIFPNPASNSVFISSQIPMNQIKIVDLAGRTIENLILEQPSLTTKLDISSLLPAVYFVTIYLNEIESTKKLFICR